MIAQGALLPSSHPPPHSHPSCLQHVQPIGLKPPRMEATTWSGKSYDFYSWLASTTHVFTFSNCHNTAKTQIMLQAMLLDKRGSFFNITDWNKFKNKLINDFGNVTAYRCEVQCQFNHSPRSDSMKELVDVLAPKVQQLVTTLNCLAIFHPTNKLLNLTLTPALNKAIISAPSFCHPPSIPCQSERFPLQ